MIKLIQPQITSWISFFLSKCEISKAKFIEVYAGQLDGSIGCRLYPLIPVSTWCAHNLERPLNVPHCTSLMSVMGALTDLSVLFCLRPGASHTALLVLSLCIFKTLMTYQTTNELSSSLNLYDHKIAQPFSTLLSSPAKCRIGLDVTLNSYQCPSALILIFEIELQSFKPVLRCHLENWLIRITTEFLNNSIC